MTAPIPRERLCKSALTKTGIPAYDYCLNPYVGCAHACAYCYASFMCRFTGHKEPWGTFLDVKTNFPAVLAKQLRGRTNPQGKVIVGSVTDAYQSAERDYRITAASLEILADYGRLEVDILTKSALITRDIHLLRRLPACAAGFTITTPDPAVARILEPGASPPPDRLAAARELLAAGIAVWVFIAPILPGLTDTGGTLGALLDALRAAGVREILLDSLNPYPAVVSRLKNLYRRHFPAALPGLEEYLRHPGRWRDELRARLGDDRSLTWV
jgi:DNA repair photolyase